MQSERFQEGELFSWSAENWKYSITGPFSYLAICILQKTLGTNDLLNGLK